MLTERGIRQIEEGQRPPTAKELEEIAEVLGIPRENCELNGRLHRSGGFRP